MNHELVIFEMQAQLCRSLGHAIRLRIIHTLKEGPKSVNEIATIVGQSQPTVSRHLSVLRSSGLLTAHRKGIEVYYEITNSQLVEICAMMRGILGMQEMKRLGLLHSIRN